MANELNKFLKELKTVIENGFMRGSRQFLGTGASAPFNAKNYRGEDTPFRVITQKPNRDDFTISPLIAIHTFTPNRFEFVGGSGKNYRFFIECFFAEEFYKTVDGEDISGDELSRYLLDEFNDGLWGAKSEFSTITVSSLEQNTGEQQDGKLGNTTIYGFRTSFTVAML